MAMHFCVCLILYALVPCVTVRVHACAHVLTHFRTRSLAKFGGPSPSAEEYKCSYS